MRRNHLSHSIAKALCRADDDRLVGALNFALPGDGNVPDWVELIPAGDSVQGQDGRAWIKGDPQAIVDASVSGAAATQGMLPFDWEHSSELKAPNGEPAPASGWIVELQARQDGSIWGRIDWTEAGAQSIASKSYRFVSPVFMFDKNTRQIVRLTSAALTNNPNLTLTALNRGGVQIPGQPSQETDTMLPEEIRKALGLSEGATVADAQTAINSLRAERDTALNRAETPSLDKFVPRADYDTAINRAAAAEQKLADHAAQQLDAEIETAVNGALKDGKITPATVDYHKANCRREGGLDAFKAYVAAAPVIGDASGLDGKKPGETETALNGEAKKIADMFGNSAEELAKNREVS